MAAKQPRKTATIERYHVYGTPRFELRVTYRGECLRWSSGNGTTSFAVVQDDPSRLFPTFPPVDVQACRDHAKRQGFTHVRIVGDWPKRTKPQGGAL